MPSGRVIELAVFMDGALREAVPSKAALEARVSAILEQVQLVLAYRSLETPVRLSVVRVELVDKKVCLVGALHSAFILLILLVGYDAHQQEFTRDFEYGGRRTLSSIFMGKGQNEGQGGIALAGGGIMIRGIKYS